MCGDSWMTPIQMMKEEDFLSLSDNVMVLLDNDDNTVPTVSCEQLLCLLHYENNKD
jgi:hypothetical protein